MPTYVYQCIDNGEIVEVSMSSADKSRRENEQGDIVLGTADGLMREEVTAKRKINLEQNRPQTCKAWPAEGLHSDALGVHPSQSDIAYDHSVRMGVPTDFDRETGCAVFRSRQHRKRYVEELNRELPPEKQTHDLDGGYSDP